MPHLELGQLPPNTSVFVCDHVARRIRPALYVVHDGDGDLQVLCGGDDGHERPELACLRDVLAVAPELASLVLDCGHAAERASPTAPWILTDEYEQGLLDNVRTHGWQVTCVRAGATEPAFAYSIGFATTLARPEVIVFGLPADVMIAMINELGARARRGESFTPGQPIHDLLEGDYVCVLRAVHRSQIAGHLGSAVRFHAGRPFDVLQLCWPSVSRRFPWEAGVEDAVQAAQPDLSMARSA